MVPVIDRLSNTPQGQAGASAEKTEPCQRYLDLFDRSPFGCLVIDAGSRINCINLAAADALNAPQPDLIGQKFINFIHSDDQSQYLRRLDDCHASPDNICFELRIDPYEGDSFDTRLLMRSEKDPINEAAEYVITLVNVTDELNLGRHVLQHECSQLCRESDDIETLLTAYLRRINAFLQCHSVGIRIADVYGKEPIDVLNGFPQTYLTSTITDEAFLGGHDLIERVADGSENLRDSICSCNGSIYLNTASSFLNEAPADGWTTLRALSTAHGYESLLLAPIEVDGVYKGLLFAADRRRQRFPLRVVQALEGVASQIGWAIDRFRLQEDLVASAHTLKELSGHLLTIQESEQKRIAMELHDGCGQDLNVLKLRLLGVKKSLPPDAADLKCECELLLSHTDKIINDIGAIAHGLKPAALDALGLVVATGQMIREFSSLCGIQVEVKIKALQEITDLNAQLCLFRIFQEALNNIRKHSQATWVLISANLLGKKMRITIRDNGKGFEPVAPSVEISPAMGMGLSTMSLRCQMIGGQIDIKSSVRRGTQLTVWLPCSSHGEGRP